MPYALPEPIFSYPFPIINTLPYFTLHPQSQTVDEYATATFTAASNNATSYQWYKNGLTVGVGGGTYSFAVSESDRDAVITVNAINADGVVSSNPATLVVQSYVYRMDGLTQYATLSSPISVPTGAPFELEFYFNAIGNAFNPVMSDSTTGSNFMRTLLNAGGLQALIGGNYYSPATNLNDIGRRRLNFVHAVGNGKWYLDGVEISSRNDSTISAVVISQLAKQGADSAVLNGDISKLRLWTGGNKTTGTLANSVQMNNKAQGANQLATVGGVNATIVNYNAAGWVAI